MRGTKCPCDAFFKTLLFAKTLWNMRKQSLQSLDVSAHAHCFVASAAFPWFLRLLLLEVLFSMRHLPDIICRKTKMKMLVNYYFTTICKTFDPSSNTD